MTITSPAADVQSLLDHTYPHDPADRALALRHAPFIRFDEREPFLPLAAGFTVFRSDAPSPSFPRRITLRGSDQPSAKVVIEYAVWWDWDIGHLYELEHIWLYLDADENLVWAEASWHGGFHEMLVEGQLPLEDGRLCVHSEPGKHAFAPEASWLYERADQTRRACTRFAGIGGLLVTRLFTDLIPPPNPRENRLVWTYLSRHAFEPSFNFSRRVSLGDQLLLPWPQLFGWIPRRMAAWLQELDRILPIESRRFWRIAHRGASAHAPDNSRLAIERAAELGADMVELDLQVSADGEVVVFHDADLKAKTGVPGPVATYTLAELQQFDLGAGQTILSLTEALALCVELRLGLYLELKSRAAIEPMLALLAEQDRRPWAMVASFRPDWLAEVKAREPRLRTAILFQSPHIDPVALAQACNADYVHPAWETQAAQPHTLLTSDWLARVRAAGLGIIIWHEERPTEIAALRALDVDGICSNAPELLAAE